METSELEISLPSSPEEWEIVRNGFMKKSYQGLFHGCVGALDGFFQPTIAPSKKEVQGNVTAYYSGHYESYGLNCQAACDVHLRFLWFGVVGPGKTNDNVAFPRCGELYKTVMDLPFGLFFVGDAAYTLCETLLVPFTGSQRDNADNDAFNFYLSQLRIRIEMSFGRLVRKFAILQRNMETQMSTTSTILMVCARLHNYVINCELLEKGGDLGGGVNDELKEDDDLHCTLMEGTPAGMQYLPILPDEEFKVIRGMSMTRLALVEEIRRKNHRRPTHNSLRNSNLNDSTDRNSSRTTTISQDHVGNAIDDSFYHPM